MSSANVRKIDVMIAGAQKAGTSSLKSALEQHPEIFSHKPLECDFFASDEKDWESYYRDYFVGDGKIVLGKLAHLAQNEKYVGKFHKHNPDAYIIFVLREPLSRLRSAYEMESQVWADFPANRFISAILAQEKGEYDLVYNTFIKLGDYGILSDNILRFFPLEKILFVDFAELKESPVELCSRIYNRLGLKPFNNMPVHENARRSLKYKKVNRLVAYASRSKFRVLLESIIGRAPLLYVKKIINKLNTSKVGENKVVPWGNDVTERIAKYYKEADQRFISLTGHTPSWRKDT